MRKKPSEFKPHCPGCDHKDRMRCIRSYALRTGVRAAAYQCRGCHLKWIYHGETLMGKSETGNNQTVKNKKMFCKCSGLMIVFSSKRKPIGNVAYYKCKNCNERTVYINGVFARILGEPIQLMPGARFIPGRCQSGSE